MSKSFGDQAPKIAHLVHIGKGGLPGEIADLRKDVDAGFAASEARTGFPEIHWVDGGLLAAGGDHVIKGANLLQDQEFASLTLFSGTSELIFTALSPGEAGNDLTIEIQDTGSLTVTKTANAIVITIDLGTTTADAIATAVNANGADTDGYLRCDGGGAGVAQAVTAATNLTGGSGDGWSCEVSGVACLPANTTGANGAAAITDTQATVTVPNLTSETDARAVGDIVTASINSNGVRADISGILA